MVGIAFIITILVALTLVTYLDSLVREVTQDLDTFDDLQEEFINQMVDLH